MLVFVLTYPGAWLALPNGERANSLGHLLSLVEGQFVDAVVALDLFCSAKKETERHPAASRENWERNVALSNRVEVELEAERVCWDSEIVPLQYALRPLFLHARSFVYALDGLVKLLHVISQEPEAPSEVKVEIDAIVKSFPALLGVRDSAQHPEDRGRGLGKTGKPLNLKPGDNPWVEAPGTALVLGSLNGNKYGYTMANGGYGEVEVSVQSLRTVQRCVQNVINAFPWKGPQRHSP